MTPNDWKNSPIELQKAVAKLAAVMHYAEGSGWFSWQIVKGPRGEIFSIKWPGRIPETLYREMKKELAEPC